MQNLGSDSASLTGAGVTNPARPEAETSSPHTGLILESAEPDPGLPENGSGPDLLGPDYSALEVSAVALTGIVVSSLVVLTVRYFHSDFDVRGVCKAFLVPILMSMDLPLMSLMPEMVSTRRVLPFFGYEPVQMGSLLIVYIIILASLFTNMANTTSGMDTVQIGQLLVASLGILAHSFHQENLTARFLVYQHIILSAGLYYGIRKSRSNDNFGRLYGYISGSMYTSVVILGEMDRAIYAFFVPQMVDLFLMLCRLLLHPKLVFSSHVKYSDHGDYWSIGFSPEFDKSCHNRLIIDLLEFIGVLKIRYSLYDYNRFSISDLTLAGVIIHVFGKVNNFSLTAIMVALQMASCLLALFVV